MARTAAWLFACWTAFSAPARAAEDAMGLYLQGLQHAADGETDGAIADLSAAVQLDSSAAEIPRELARVLIDARRLEEALPVALKAQRMAPDDADANWLVGQVRMLRREPQEAVESLEQARRLDPTNRSRLISLVLVYEAVGRNADALDLLLPDRGGTAPDSPLLYLHRGMLLARGSRPKEATEDFLAVLRMAPDFPGATDQLIATCSRMGPSDSTAAIYLRALELVPDRNDLRRECARTLIILGRQQEAIPLLERLHTDDPRDPAVTMQLGVIRFGQDRLQEAIPLLRQARQIDPTLQDADAWLWRAYNRADSLESALRIADGMVAAAPGGKDGHWYRAMSLARLDRPDSALAEMDRVLRIVPDDRDAGLLRALILMDQGRIDEARDGLVRMAEKRPDDREILFRLGGLEQRAGRVPEAIAWYRRLLEKHPGDAAAMNEAGYLCAEEGMDLPQALIWTEQASKLDPRNAAYLDSYGWALFKLERYEEAIGPLRRAAALDLQEPLLKIHLAKALYAAGLRAEGKQVLRDLLVEKPDERQARELLQLWDNASPSQDGNSR